MPPATLPALGSTETANLSDYRNYWAILAAVKLKCITLEQARKYLQLPQGKDIDEVDFTQLNGYDDHSPYRVFRGASD